MEQVRTSSADLCAPLRQRQNLVSHAAANQRASLTWLLSGLNPVRTRRRKPLGPGLEETVQMKERAKKRSDSAGPAEKIIGSPTHPLLIN